MRQPCRTFGNLTKELFSKKLTEANAIPMHPRLAKAPTDMSVLIPLLEVNSTPSVLFTKRSIHLKSHRGEVCFPGGRMEQGESIEQAALRETHEEIGVEPDSVEVWGRLKPVFTRTMTDTVVPIVGCIGYEALRTDCVNKNERLVSCSNAVLRSTRGIMPIYGIYTIQVKTIRVHFAGLLQQEIHGNIA
nr:NUDIX hydrolase domain containing protein [Haemonchus contortus]